MKKIGKYEIVDVLGKGAMGIVYKARDPDIGREVAVKAIHFDAVREAAEREEVIKRFMQEGRAAGRLNHPNIVTIYDVGREGDLTYIVMQHVPGQNLQKLMDTGRSFTPEETGALMLPLLRAVDYAHQNGVVHRDIKPGNVVIDPEGVPHLADFGVAKTAASTLTLAGTALGTPGYISPEQLKGQVADGRSDIFSLGILLYVLLTGREPFAGKKLSTVMHRIVHDEAPPPSSLKPGLPAGWDVVVGRAMAKNPQDRYQSCAEMAAALDSLAKSDASTLTVKLREADREKEKRGRGRLAALVTGLVLLILGAAAAAVFIFRVFEKSRPAQAEGRTSPPVVTPAAPPPPADPPDPLASKLATLQESFERGSFEETTRLAKDILAEDPSRSEAKDWLTRAEQKIREADLSRRLAGAAGLLESRKYDQCLQALASILKDDPANSQALRLQESARTALSEAAIGRVLERQRQAEEEKDLVVLLADAGSSEAAAARKEEALLLFNYYDDIKSQITNVTIQFSDRTRARARFLHVVTGFYKKTKEKKVLVQDVQTWLFEKAGREWKVIDFHGEAASDESLGDHS